MAVKVVDASALADLLFGEPEGESVAAKLGDVCLVGPILLGFELANVCLIKTCRHPKQAQALAAAFKLRHQLGIEEMAVDHDQIFILGVQTGLTGYDASYLWLARQLGAELVTLDRQLERAAAVF